MTNSKSHSKKQLKLYMHPPSIPTKFQTIHYDDNEQKGFSSTAKRFDRKGNDLPGPGYYARAAEKLDEAFANVSISKKGLGGFASKYKRFEKPPTDLETNITVSPAQYHPQAPNYSKLSTLSPAFRQPIYDLPTGYSNCMVRTKTGMKPLPGPGEYRTEKLKGTIHAISSVFKSKTARTYLDTPTKPSNQDEDEEDQMKREPQIPEKPIGPTSSFKASGRDQHNQPKKGPSPGQYDITKPMTTIKRTRVRVKLGHIAQPPLPPAEPSSNQVAVPGSGFTPIAFPSPGHYDIAKGGDAIHKKQPEPKSIFLSKSSRFCKVAMTDTPGPCQYHPFPQTKHQSFHLNLEQHWA